MRHLRHGSRQARRHHASPTSVRMRERYSGRSAISPVRNICRLVCTACIERVVSTSLIEAGVGRSACRQSWNRWTSCSKRENGRALRSRDSDLDRRLGSWQSQRLGHVTVGDEHSPVADQPKRPLGGAVPALAAAVITALPVVIVYLALQRYFESGLAAGALK